MSDQKLKVKFAPGVLDQLEQDLSTDQLQELFDAIAESIEDGSFLTDSEPVDLELLQTEDPELYEQLMDTLEQIENEENQPLPRLH